MTDYTKLIAALEAALGPSRELDNDIAVWRGEIPKLGGFLGWRYTGTGIYRRPHHDDGGEDVWEAPAYTESIDAALSFTPEELAWLVRSHPPYACLWEPKGVGDKTWETGTAAATPAIALCIANLRALGKDDES